MDIKYLKQLNNYPTVKRGNTDYISTLRPLTMQEITKLEIAYNNGAAFPGVLRELLYLAGNYCHVLDYGLSDSQEEMQQDARSWLANDNQIINRPFFVIDIYNGGDQFLFVYLDEEDDPIVHEAILYNVTPAWIHSLNKKLSEFISSRLTRFLSGQNPF
jgi:hypothetical protein